jgi:hypothetical protein
MTKHTIMESVKIDYLVENTFREKPVLQKKRNYVLIFSSSDVAAFRTIQAYFLNISLCQEQQFTSQVPQPQSGKHKA